MSTLIEITAAPPRPASMTLPVPAPHRSAAESTAGGLSLWPLAAVLLYAGGLLSIDLGSRALTYHEVLFAQPAREMLASGDWIVPRIAGVAYVEKPPATAWAIALTMWLSGSTSEWAARLPCVLAELVTALTVTAVAARWFGGRVALIAGCMQASSVYVLMQGRLAESDMLLTAAVTLAWAALAWVSIEAPVGLVHLTRHGRRPSPAIRSWFAPLIFYAAAGMSFLIKGPLGPLMILGGAAATALLDRRHSSWRFFANPVGLAVFFACITLWPLAVYVAYPPILDVWLVHHWGRFRGDLGGQFAPAFYLHTSLWLLLPWSPLVLWAGFRSLRQGHHFAPQWRFVIAWMVPGWVLLSASQFQHKHYIVPLLPPLALPAALGLLASIHERRREARLGPWSLLPLIAIGTTLCVAIVLHQQRPAARAIALLSVAIGVGLAALVYVEYRRWLRIQLIGTLGLAWFVSAGVLLLVMPSFDSYESTRQFAEEVNRKVRPNVPTYLVGLPNHPATFYLRIPLHRVDDPEQVFAEAARSTRSIHVLGPARLESTLLRHGTVHVDLQQRELPRNVPDTDRPTLFRLNRGESSRDSKR